MNSLTTVCILQEKWNHYYISLTTIPWYLVLSQASIAIYFGSLEHKFNNCFSNYAF